MAETISIDWSPVVNAVRNVQSDVRTVDYNVRVIYDNVATINKNIGIVYNQIELMRRESRMNFAYQRAISEIVGLRQEIQQKFSAHQKVRDYMIGILQANDLALVKKDTIANCTEELMIAAPDYWLAPSLIALAAWISNNSDLANRALKEALRRDKEKTCLLFALICNRAGRTDACYEWLNQYFRLQKPTAMRRSVIAFIDAYSSGVFGEDKKHICEEHITEWMRQLKASDPEFDNRQKAFWEQFFSLGKAPAGSIESDTKYNTVLKALSPEWGEMDSFINRIVTCEDEHGQIGKLKDIHNAKVDLEQLKKDIDEQLKRLVTNYEEGSEEADLRDKEAEFQVIKALKGDEDKAKAVIAFRKELRKDQPVDFAKRLEMAIVSDSNTNASIAGKKAALNLLKGWMREAYTNYITANKDRYPDEINLKFNQHGAVLNTTIPGSKTYTKDFVWTGKTKDAENRKVLEKSISDQFDKERDEAISKVKPNVLAIFPGVIFLGIPTIITFSRTKKRKAELADKYENAKNSLIKTVNTALDGRVEANKVVSNFLGKEDWDKLSLGADDYYEAPKLEEVPDEIPEVDLDAISKEFGADNGKEVAIEFPAEGAVKEVNDLEAELGDVGILAEESKDAE